ncbi:MAG: hypothetical protein ABJN26_09440 [Stappiaceae bacterium]
MAASESLAGVTSVFSAGAVSDCWFDFSSSKPPCAFAIPGASMKSAKQIRVEAANNFGSEKFKTLILKHLPSNRFLYDSWF